MMHGRTIQLIALVFGLFLFVYSVLALVQAGGGSSCHWAFPKWFGCVLSAHETLAGGLIGASGALIAAWIAWGAIQAQINAERERTMADRLEVERLLAEDLTDYADGMAAAWRLLDELSHHTNPDRASTERVRDATAYMANRLSRPEEIANYRAMAEILGWDRRRRYNALISGLEELKAFNDSAGTWNLEDALTAIRNLANHFEYCLPNTSDYFNGLWRRSPKAWTFAGYVESIGGA
jgi:hypothetical protein